MIALSLNGSTLATAGEAEGNGIQLVTRDVVLAGGNHGENSSQGGNRDEEPWTVKNSERDGVDWDIGTKGQSRLSSADQ